MSLFAMLPSPIIYGAIIDNTCLLWQVGAPWHLDLTSSSRRNAGKLQTVYSTTLTCKFLVSHDVRPKFARRLRTYLMYTTAAIMSVGVLFDVLVVYYAKFVQPYPLLFKTLIQRPGHLPGSRGGGNQRSDGPISTHHSVSFSFFDKFFEFQLC